VNYAAAKSGIHGFTKALVQEGAAQGITFNTIAPGYVDTDMVRAVPEDILEKNHPADAHRPSGLGREYRLRRAVPDRRRGGLYQRVDPFDRRRPAYVLTGFPVIMAAGNNRPEVFKNRVVRPWWVRTPSYCGAHLPC